MIHSSTLASRTTSAFPLSIGTSLAFESLFAGRQPPYDPEREIPQKIDVNKYSEIWINLATLFRNIVGAVESKAIFTLSPEEMVDTLNMEIDVIRSIMAVEGHGVCKPVFYYCDYKSAYTKQNHKAVQLRYDKTDGQKVYTALLVQTMKRFFSVNHGPDFVRGDSELKPTGSPTALIVTHTPHDLLSYKNFGRLDLLESHTGKLKPRNMWYTKFHGCGQNDLDTIPFQRKLLLIFGDSVMYVPMDIRFRKMIIDISKKRHWTTLTTEPKILQDLDLDIQERYLFEMYRDL